MSEPTPAVSAAAEAPAAGFTSTDALLVCMVLIWGVNFIVLKATLRELTPPALNAIRFALGTTVVFAFAWWRGAPVPARSDVGRIVLLGLLGHGIYQQGFLGGVARTKAGNAALLMAAIPVQTAILSHLRGDHRLRWRDGLGLLLGAIGIAAIVLGGGKEVGFGTTVHGDLLILGATVCWSFFSVLSKPLTDRYGPITVTAYTMAVGTVPLVLLGIGPLLATNWSQVGFAGWGGTIYSSLGALVIAYLIWARGVQRLGAARTAIYSNFTPVVAMLAAWLVLHETPTAWQVGGAAGIFTGIWLTRT